MDRYTYEDFLRDEGEFFRLFEEKVGLPAARAMFEALDKKWAEVTGVKPDGRLTGPTSGT